MTIVENISPWKKPTINEAAQEWRGLSKKGLNVINNALGRVAITDGFLTFGGQWVAVNNMVEAVFSAEPRANERDRLDLIRWMGGATANGADTEINDRDPHRIIDIFSGIAVDRWVGCAWSNFPRDHCVSWAKKFVIAVCGGNTPTGIYAHWGDIPSNWDSLSAEYSHNAQTDLLSFLEGYEQDAIKTGVGKIESPNIKVGAITDACLALRILDGTTDRVDGTVSRIIRVLEKAYAYPDTYTEILHLTEAAADRKILEKVVQFDKMTPISTTENAAATRKRKI